jgi:hypothetical protein
MKEEENNITSYKLIEIISVFIEENKLTYDLCKKKIKLN